MTQNFQTINMSSDGLKIVLEMAEFEPAILVELIDSVLQTAPDIVQKLEVAIENNDLDNAQLYAHSLKSSTNLVGAVNLSNFCRDMELSAKTKDLTTVKEIFPKLKEEFHLVLDDLNNWKHSLDN